MEFPLISILTPAYNHERFVERCLDSILEDPYPNKELIIIDDGSTDGTPEKISAWVTKHADAIQIGYISRVNQGVSVTLNELIARAKGEFLRFVASDDYLLSGGLVAQANYLRAHPYKLAVIGDSVVVNERGEILYESGMADLHRVRKSNYLSDDGIRKEIISRWALGGPVHMFRKGAFETIGGWSEDLRIEDWDLFLRLAARNALGFIDVRVCAYRLHARNTSRTVDTDERIANLGDMEKSAHRQLDLFGEPFKSRLRAQCFLIAAKIAFLKRKPLAVVVNMVHFALLRVAAKLKAPGFMRGTAIPLA